VRASDTITLPSYDELSTDKPAFTAMTRLLMHETNPYTARQLVQFHGREAVVVNPPAWSLAEAEMDRIYGLPFTRRPHPSYGRRKIPAYEVVKDSIQIVRGCFGGCAFCSLSAHQGKIIQNRSLQSILEEIGRVADEADFSGVISDLAARPPTLRHALRLAETQRECRRTSCLYPSVCTLLVTDHGPLLDSDARGPRAAGRQAGVHRLGRPHGFGPARSGVCAGTAEHHTGGLLKVAPSTSIRTCSSK